MKIPVFIEKAIEGGCKEFDVYFDEEDKTTPKIEQLFSDPEFIVAGYFLSPEVWQAVGKVEGWNENYSFFSTEKGSKRGWGDYMHQMIDALAEGKTIEGYLNTL